MSNAWPYREARRIRIPEDGRPVVFECGYGPSGLPHIGTFAEVARTTMVRNAFEDLTGHPTRLIVFSDDMDALRSVPDNVPNRDEMEKWIGYSLTRVPDPFGTHESFAHHNNAMLREFLDRFRFQYEFLSATECYESGMFDEALSVMWNNYGSVMDIILPTLGEDRRATYSPFMPRSSEGWIYQTGVARAPSKNCVILNDDGDPAVMRIHRGNVKCQWKADWALRWLALGVDYEMAGKDLTDSVTLSSKIVRALGARPPVNMIYEMFLDEDGHKISKSKGNGFTIDEWLRYGSAESLLAYLYGQPQRAKKLGARLVPTAMDDLNEMLRRYETQDAEKRLDNPAFHVGRVLPPLSVSYQLVLNLAQTAAPETADALMPFVLKVAEDSPRLRRMVELAFNYYSDHLRGELQRREPTEDERAQLRELATFMRALPADAGEEDIQYWVYEIGKAHYGKEALREWFKVIYQTVLGQDSGPRFGTFAVMYGLPETITLLESL